MDYSHTIKQLNDKYYEIFSKYWSVLIDSKVDSTNQEIKNYCKYLDNNVKYIEKYLSILKMNSGDANMSKEIEKNNYIKEIMDALYNPEKTQTQK
jgi:hypothetical protein